MNDSLNSDAKKRLTNLADDYWEVLLKRNPTMATDLGDHRYDDVLPDYRLEARAQYFEEIHALDRRLRTISNKDLTGQQAITHEVLESMLELELAAEPFLDEEWTINPLHGPTTWLVEFPEKQPLVPREAFHKLLARLGEAGTLISRVEERLTAGITKGTTAPRIGVERVAAQLGRILKTPPENSAFIPSGESPEGLSESQFNARKQELADIVAKVVYPALKHHAEYLEKKYLPVARKEPGLCAMPGGAEYYRYLVEMYTGRKDSPETIHEIGREELRRLHAEMKEIGRRIGGTTDIRQTVAQLRARPEQYIKDRNAFLEHNRRLFERANAALPAYFSRLPKRKCEVRAIERYRELDSPSGFYCRAPDDGQRPAYYYVNTLHPDQRPLYNTEALAFHEAVPGHHLQIAIAQDLGELPAVRRHLGQTAYVEGWALYAERLSDEMGIYSNDLARFGMLNYQLFRAARLVIDTGIHALGWSRDRGVQELLANTAHGEPEALIEVDRYVCMPGQALAYMIGRLAFDSLREHAQNRLGPRFDIKAYHTCVLENGAVPLSTLRHIVERWADKMANEASPQTDESESERPTSNVQRPTSNVE